MELDEALVELSSRRKARESYVDFCRYLFPDEPPANHHEVICNALDKVVSGELRRLMIFCPPGSAKSTYSSVRFPPYYLGRFPKKNIICGSYGEGLATSFGRKVRNIVLDKEYSSLFPTSLAEDARAKGEWETNEGGTYFSCITLDTPIKTLRGTVRAEEVVIGDKVHSHNGFLSVYEVINSAHKKTITIDGVSMSPTHPVWTYNKGWVSADKVSIDDLLHVESIVDIMKALLREVYYGSSMEYSNVPQMVQHEVKMLKSKEREMGELRWARNWCLKKMDGFRELLRGYWEAANAEAHDWSDRQRWGLLESELSMGGCLSATKQQAKQCKDKWENSCRAWERAGDNSASNKIQDDEWIRPSINRQEKKENVWGYSNPEANGRVRSWAIQLLSGRSKVYEQRESSSSVTWHTSSIKRAAQKLFGLLLGVRQASRIEHVSHEPKPFINYKVGGDNTFFSDGILTHNCGVGSGVTGRRADLGLIDDPVKGQKDADSPTVREDTWNWYKSDFFSRLKPNAAQVIIMTRWQEDDLCGRILPDDWNGESGEFEGFDGQIWTVISMPAEAKENDILGRKEGEWLWTDFFTPEVWEEIKYVQTSKGTDFRLWGSLYQQQPQPDQGVFFKREWFNRYKLGEEPDIYTYAASDYAVSEGKGDWTEHGVAGFDSNDNLWFTDWWSGQTTPEQWIDHQIRLAKKHKPFAWLAEVGVIRRAVEPFLKKAKKVARCYFRQEWMPHIGDKGANARSFQALSAMGQVYIPQCEWGDDLVDQLVKFIPNTNFRDDKVDVCGLLGRILDTAFAPTAQVKEPERHKVDEYGFDEEPANNWKTG